MIRQCTLSEITHNVTDGKHGDCLNEQDSGFYFVSVKDIKSGGIDYHNARQITQRDYIETHKRTRFEAGDILLANSGHTIGKMVYAKDSKYISKTTFQKSVAIIKPDIKKVDGVFLYYNLLANVKGLRRAAVGSAQPNLLLRDLRSFKLDIYKDVNYQSQIAKVLSNLDAKIELNNKINAELEAMAKLIYDYWFVQFDFPDENGKPYKTSGGKMVYNEELKREIPEGWELCFLGDVVNKTGTGLNPRKNFKLGEGDNYYVTIKNIDQGKVILNEKCDRINDEALRIINNRSDLRKGDILYTSIQPVGTTYLIREEPKNWNINESVFTIRPDYEKVTSEFLYMFVSGEYIKKYTSYVSAGSIHKGVRHSTLKECKFILPSKSIVDDFTKLVRPMLDKDDKIQIENQKLAELRDWLLPMLMNGQVRVN